VVLFAASSALFFDFRAATGTSLSQVMLLHDLVALASRRQDDL
jgi:hypothetical protein